MRPRGEVCLGTLSAPAARAPQRPAHSEGLATATSIRCSKSVAPAVDIPPPSILYAAVNGPRPPSVLSLITAAGAPPASLTVHCRDGEGVFKTEQIDIMTI